MPKFRGGSPQWTFTSYPLPASGALNYGSGGKDRVELGSHRALAEIERELMDGRRRLQQLFKTTQLLPILVPPWNHIDGKLVAALPRVGYRGLSTFNPKPSVRGGVSCQGVECC